MNISKLIEDLEQCKKEYDEAEVLVGVNPKALYVVMGYRTLMLKLDGDWDYKERIEDW